MVRPEHVRAYLGDTVMFLCSSSSSVRWKAQTGNMGNNWESSIVQRNNYQLTITKIRNSNAGKYQCMSEKNNVIYYGVGKLSIEGKCISRNAAVMK